MRFTPSRLSGEVRMAGQKELAAARRETVILAHHEFSSLNKQRPQLSRHSLGKMPPTDHERPHSTHSTPGKERWDARVCRRSNVYLLRL